MHTGPQEDMVMQATVGPWRATWTGGPYADVHYAESEQALTCLNMWDYATDGPRVPVTVDALRTELVDALDVIASLGER